MPRKIRESIPKNKKQPRGKTASLDAPVSSTDPEADDGDPGANEDDPDFDEPEGAEGGDAGADESQAQLAERKKFPWLHMVCEKGAVLIGTEDREVERQMDANDYAECIEDGIHIAEEMQKLQMEKDGLEEEEKRAKLHLDGVRERYRQVRDKLVEQGHQLVELQLAARDKRRKHTTKVNISVTRGNEYVEQDAATRAILVRRNAEIPEIERSRKVKSAGLFVVPLDGSDEPEPADDGTQRTTSDSPERKTDATAEQVLVSVDLTAFSRIKRRLQKDFKDGPGEEDGWSLTWEQDPSRQPNRKYATVPRRHLSKLMTLAEGAPDLDFRVEQDG